MTMYIRIYFDIKFFNDLNVYYYNQFYTSLKHFFLWGGKFTLKYNQMKHRLFL